VRLTASLGLAMLNPQNPLLDHLLDQADQALYQAKKTRNTVRVFNEDEISV
jgi:PleD family two-component response regulator